GSGGIAFAGTGQAAVAVSPDGKYLAYAANRVPTQQIFLRAFDQSEARPLPGTEGGDGPFFSPDGQWLGFISSRTVVKKIPLTGGAALSLVNGSPVYGATWGSRGTIVFSPGSFLQQIADSGGSPQALTRLDKGETIHAWPEFLPGGT